MNAGVFPGIGGSTTQPALRTFPRVVIMKQNYTFKMEDAGSLIALWDDLAGFFSPPSPTYTIPHSMEVNFPLFTSIYVGYNEYSSPATLTITKQTGVTLIDPGIGGASITSKVLTSTSYAHLLKVGIDTWYIK